MSYPLDFGGQCVYDERVDTDTSASGDDFDRGGQLLWQPDCGGLLCHAIMIARYRGSIAAEVPLTAGYTGDPPLGLGIRGILLGCKPDKEVCGGVESDIRESRPTGW